MRNHLFEVLDKIDEDADREGLLHVTANAIVDMTFGEETRYRIS